MPEPERMSKMPGSVWLMEVRASSMTIFQVVVELVMGSRGIWRR